MLFPKKLPVWMLSSSLLAGTAIAGFAAPGIAEVSNTGETSNSEIEISQEAEAETEGDFEIESVQPDLGVHELQWTAGGIEHRGTLWMAGDTGTLQVEVDALDQPVRQDVELSRDGSGFILEGSNPSDPNYSADTFRFQLVDGTVDQISNIENCSDGPCVPVDETRLQ